MNRMIPYGHQDINSEDIEAVVSILKSDWITQGPAIERFEKAVADYCGSRYAVAVASATAGLHISCLSLGVNERSLVWTSPNTFAASANCARYCGAQVDFVDIDPVTYNLSVPELKKKLIVAKQQGRLPNVVIPVHFAGQPCEMDTMRELSREFGFAIIEDAAHAIGGRYRNQPVGNGEFSELTVFSFHPVKIITTGEGGLVLTNREDLYQKLLRLRTHGITRNPALMKNPSQGPWYMEQIELGYHYRMTDMQAALGLSQLKRIDQFVEDRHRLADKYDHELRDLPLILPKRTANSYSALHLYVIQLDSSKRTWNRRKVFEALQERGIGVNVHYLPVHRHPYYQELGFKKGQFPEAEKYYEAAITLPLYSSLTAKDQDQVIAALRDVLI